MNQLKRKLAGFTFRNQDPFTAAGTNIFDAVAKKREGEQGPANRYPAEAASPSQAVPGKQNPYPAPGQGQLETGSNRAGGSPLDSYMDTAYHGIDVEDKSKEQQKPVSLLDRDYSEFEKSLANSNFTSEADAELAEKALAGDAKAMLALLNSVTRRSAAGSTFLSAQIAKQGIGHYDSALKQEMPTMLSEKDFKSISFDDPALASPKVQPIVQATIAQFRQQFPKATPAAIKTAVQSYLKEVFVAPSTPKDEDNRPSMRDLFKGL